MGYADFCMNPTDSTLTAVGVNNPENTMKTIEFYTSCRGKNPFDDQLSILS